MLNSIFLLMEEGKKSHFRNSLKWTRKRLILCLPILFIKKVLISCLPYLTNNKLRRLWLTRQLVYRNSKPWNLLDWELTCQRNKWKFLKRTMHPWAADTLCNRFKRVLVSVWNWLPLKQVLKTFKVNKICILLKCNSSNSRHWQQIWESTNEGSEFQ